MLCYIVIEKYCKIRGLVSKEAVVRCGWGSENEFEVLSTEESELKLATIKRSSARFTWEFHENDYS